MSWTEHRIIAFDTETTGLNPFDGDRVIEFGAVELTVDAEYRVTGVKAYDWLIDPEGPIPREVTRVTGIKDEDVAGKPVFAKVAKDVHALLEGAIVVAHNLAFDEHAVRARLGVEDGDLGKVVDEDVVPPAPPQGGQVARQLEEGGAQLALARYRGDMGRYGGDVAEIWGRPSRS